jgi:hypothetical protein
LWGATTWFQRSKYGGIVIGDARRQLSDFFFSTGNLPWQRFKLLKENQSHLCLQLSTGAYGVAFLVSVTYFAALE